MKWKMYADVQRPEERASSWEEGLSSLPEGEWAGAESQRGMMKRMRRVTTDKGNRKRKYKHFVWFNLMYKKFFSFSGKDW